MQDANAKALLTALETITKASRYMTATEWADVSNAIADAAVRLETLHWRDKYRAEDDARAIRNGGTHKNLSVGADCLARVKVEIGCEEGEGL